ncbi:hypothetical protein O9X98_14800 [Agrobacterium salinitolerans]|nr:hypothetical protein [Agrobacterium salinitolerans]
MPPKSKADLIAEVQSHVIDFSSWFNDAALKAGLGIILDPEDVIANLKTSFLADLNSLARSIKEHGVHKEQVQTAVQAIAQTLQNPGQSGIVLGALQSGKTGTAFMTLFAAPIHYLKSKISYVPLFMTTNQNSHLSQTQRGMRAFFKLYGNITITSNGESRSLLDYYAESGTDLATAGDETSTSLNEYTNKIVESIDPTRDPVDLLVKEMTVKRVPRDISGKVRSYCNRAREAGHAVMLIVDEPQYGASGQTMRKGEPVPCLLTRTFQEIDPEFFSPDSPNFMVGLSATPFDTAILSRLWKVNQKLNSSYVGPNVFGGERIDPTVITQLPTVLSFNEVAKSNKVLDWFKEIPYLVGSAASPDRKSFKPTVTLGDGTKREMDILDRRKKAANMIRMAIDGILKDRQNGHEPIGALLRIANKRIHTEDILEVMGVDRPDSPYNVIRFYDTGADVKQVIEEATRHDKRPYVVVTIGKGRMGDAFPGSTVLAMDLTHTATDANALLQGMIGRMCGYGKKDPVVIVSNQSYDMWEQYLENSGATPDFNTSRHVSTAVHSRGSNRGETYFMLTNEMIDSDYPDSPLRAFRADIIAYLEQQELAKMTMSKDVPRRTDSYMNYPELMEKHGVIKYIAENSMRLDPELRSEARIAPMDHVGEYQRRDQSTAQIKYDRNEKGHGRVLISKVDYAHAASNTSANSRERASGLGAGGRREPAKHVNRGRRNEKIVPVITVKKVNENGTSVSFHEHGRFVFDGMVFHLEEKVRRYNQAVVETSLALNHAFAPAMTNPEKARQLGVVVYQTMYGPREQTFHDAFAQARVQRVLSSIYDMSTHTYDFDGRSIVFRNLLTDAVENPKGPAIIDMTDFRNIVSFDTDEYGDARGTTVDIEDASENDEASPLDESLEQEASPVYAPSLPSAA